MVWREEYNSWMGVREIVLVDSTNARLVSQKKTKPHARKTRQLYSLWSGQNIRMRRKKHTNSSRRQTHQALRLHVERTQVVRTGKVSSSRVGNASSSSSSSSPSPPREFLILSSCSSSSSCSLSSCHTTCDVQHVLYEYQTKAEKHNNDDAQRRQLQ